ncbi:hypothetical protein ACQY0O_005824 [Thecaphora frezii]
MDTASTPTSPTYRCNKNPPTAVLDTLVPRDYSSFAIDKKDGWEDTSSDLASSDSEQTRLRHCSRSSGRQGRRRGRGAGGDSSPTRLGKRHLPDLTYAAAVASEGSRSTDDEEDGASVASSVGQNVTPSESLTMNQRLRRGPSYPPRAACSLSTPPDAAATAAAAATADASSCGGAGSVYNGAASTPPAQLRLRLRLLSNSSHLLKLSLELEMIKKQKISGLLKQQWDKHRANNFVPLPKRSFGFVGSKRGSAAVSALLLVGAAKEAGVIANNNQRCSP